jgi:hypothetical protein
MLHVSNFHAGHFQTVFLRGKSRSFSPLGACGIEISVVYIHRLFAIEKQITKLVLDGLFID